MSSKQAAPNQGKQVQCYMDIKIGPRFAGRIVFEVRASTWMDDDAWMRRTMIACVPPPLPHPTTPTLCLDQ